MKKEIKLEKRKPTWNYILNDIALYSLLIKVIHSNSATSQEKFDLMYQVELLQSQLKAKEEVIKEAIDCLDEYFYESYCYVGSEERLYKILSKGENK